MLYLVGLPLKRESQLTVTTVKIEHLSHLIFFDRFVHAATVCGTRASCVQFSQLNCPLVVRNEISHPAPSKNGPKIGGSV